MGEGGAKLSMAPLLGGMASGGTSVTIRIDLPDGTTILTETSLALLRTAVDAFSHM